MEINSKKIDELYKEWSGEHHTTNSNKQVHDSAECTDFAEYCLKCGLSEWQKADAGENTLPIQRVNRWAYLYDNWSAIMLGFGIAISFSILLNMIENIVVKIALIIHGG